MRATRQAAARGISRSQFVTQAVQAYLDQLEAESLTDAIDEAVGLLDGDESAQAAVSAGRQRLDQREDRW